MRANRGTETQPPFWENRLSHLQTTCSQAEYLARSTCCLAVRCLPCFWIEQAGSELGFKLRAADTDQWAHSASSTVKGGLPELEAFGPRIGRCGREFQEQRAHRSQTLGAGRGLRARCSIPAPWLGVGSISLRTNVSGIRSWAPPLFGPPGGCLGCLQLRLSSPWQVGGI